MKWWRAALYESDIFTLSKVLFITNKSQYPQPSVYIQRRRGPLLAVMVDINLRLRSPDLRCARARAPPLEALLESGSGICNIVRGKTRSFLHTTARAHSHTGTAFYCHPSNSFLCSSNFLFRPLSKYLQIISQNIYSPSAKIVQAEEKFKLYNCCGLK